MVWASNRIPNLSDEPKADYPTSVIPVPGATNIQVVLFPADSLGWTDRHREPLRWRYCSDDGVVVNGPKRRGQTAKALSLPQNASILTEVFGPMWLARGHDRK
jgi:hypothetical protein